jgi:hypothetical protein
MFVVAESDIIRDHKIVPGKIFHAMVAGLAVDAERWRPDFACFTVMVLENVACVLGRVSREP